MIGIDDALYRQYPAALWEEWLTSRPGSAEVRLVFRKPNGDLTSGIASSRFADYVKKNWVVVGIGDEVLEREINEARIPKAEDTFPRQTTAKAEKK